MVSLNAKPFVDKLWKSPVPSSKNYDSWISFLNKGKITLCTGTVNSCIYLIQRQSPVPPLSSTLTNTRPMKLTHRVVLDYQMHSLFLGISFKFIDKLLDLCSGHEISNSLKEPSIYVHYRYYPPFSFSADKRWVALGPVKFMPSRSWSAFVSTFATYFVCGVAVVSSVVVMSSHLITNRMRFYFFRSKRCERVFCVSLPN